MQSIRFPQFRDGNAALQGPGSGVRRCTQGILQPQLPQANSGGRQPGGRPETPGLHYQCDGIQPSERRLRSPGGPFRRYQGPCCRHYPHTSRSGNHIQRRPAQDAPRREIRRQTQHSRDHIRDCSRIIGGNAEDEGQDEHTLTGKNSRGTEQDASVQEAFDGIRTDGQDGTARICTPPALQAQGHRDRGRKGPQGQFLPHPPGSGQCCR